MQELPTMATAQLVGGQTEEPNASDFRGALTSVEFIPNSFYQRPAPMVAWDLLGKTIMHDSREGITAAIIVETEAYLGKADSACHAAYGETPRSRIFFHSEPGTVYVFHCHGDNYCFNVLTGGDNPAGCVLVRAVEPVVGIELMLKRRPVDDIYNLTSGPGKLSKALGITKKFNGLMVTEGPIKIVDSSLNTLEKAVSRRVGVSTEQDVPLRYYLSENRYVSRLPPKPY